MALVYEFFMEFLCEFFCVLSSPEGYFRGYIIYLSVFMITPKVMNRSEFYVGRTWPKEEVITILDRGSDYILDTKNPKFSKVPFSMYFK